MGSRNEMVSVEGVYKLSSSASILGTGRDDLEDEER
jgi:hypothetical protein